jgi:hypothetical protein
MATKWTIEPQGESKRVFLTELNLGDTFRYHSISGYTFLLTGRTIDQRFSALKIDNSTGEVFYATFSSDAQVIPLNLQVLLVQK